MGTCRLTVQCRPFEATAPDEGYGFTRAEERSRRTASAAEVRFSGRREQKHTSGAKALIRPGLYGTGKPVPYVECRGASRQQRTSGLPGFLDECVEPEAAVLIAGCAHCNPG
jgi:hypothetical protein